MAEHEVPTGTDGFSWERLQVPFIYIFSISYRCSKLAVNTRCVGLYSLLLHFRAVCGHRTKPRKRPTPSEDGDRIGNGRLACDVSILHTRFEEFSTLSAALASELRIPFASEKHANIAKQTLEVDRELQPQAVKRTLEVDGQYLVA